VLDWAERVIIERGRLVHELRDDGSVQEYVSQHHLFKQILFGQNLSGQESRPDEVRLKGRPMQGEDPSSCWFGYLGYEAMTLLSEGPEGPLPTASDLPDGWLVRPALVLAWDHRTQTTWLWGSPDEWGALCDEIEQSIEGIVDHENNAAALKPETVSTVKNIPIPDIYAVGIQRLKEYLLSGDLYQANYTWRFESEVSIAGSTLFERLAATNPASHAALINLGEGGWVVSSSPEVYLRTRPDGWLETRPIKGTRSTADCKNVTQRRCQLADLLSSEKDRAEHVMIVDVKRNDLGRVAMPGQVFVERMMRPLTLPNLLHLESSIIAKPRESENPLAALAALFPGGSISGAPKIRACEVIRELEPARRNVFTGCIGWIGQRHQHWNIAIRTAYRRSESAPWVHHAGGGIVIDSTPEDEWQECLAKSEKMRRALNFGSGQYVSK
jgi:anthranilate/para-aminobenzoate synthase component I